MVRFKDRTQAGQKLAQALQKYRGQDVIVYALPRGGVVIGAEIIKVLQVPLDLLIIRKVGHPGNPEYALGAISENGQLVCNTKEVIGVDKTWLKQEVEKEKQEAKRRRKIYLKGRKPFLATGKIAIIVDDGVATGLTMESAILEIKHQNPQKIVVVVPISPKDTAQKIGSQIDEFIALDIPEEFLGSVGAYYENFPQVSDQEVIDLLDNI